MVIRNEIEIGIRIRWDFRVTREDDLARQFQLVDFRPRKKSDHANFLKARSLPVSDGEKRIPNMLVVRNLFHPHHKRALSTSEESHLLPASPGTEEHIEHHAINPRVISDVILVFPPLTPLQSCRTDRSGLKRWTYCAVCSVGGSECHWVCKVGYCGRIC